MKPYHDKSILENHYINENKTCKEIAKIYGVTHTVIWDWVKKFNIPTRLNHTRKNLPPTEKQKQGRKKTGDKLKGRIITDDWREKISRSMSGSNHPNYGKKCRSHGTRIWYTCPNGEIVSMRSNWEACYADWLTQNFIKWEYEPQTFPLINGSAYTPDFFLSDLNQYIEVKGWLHAVHKAKIDGFREAYPNLNLILANKEYLKNIGCDLTKKHLSNKPSREKNCPICDVVFDPKVKQQIYCSVQCRNKYIATSPKQIKEFKSKRPGNYKQFGTNNNSSKLTEDKVLEIIRLRRDGLTLKSIANITNASVGNVGNILKGRSWKHLTDQ